MLSLREHFVQFLASIQPKEDRAALARNIPEDIRNYLKDTDKIKTVYPHTRLSGSYSRNTAIKKINDVDILLFVDNEYKDGEETVQKVINELVNALQGFPEYLQDENGYVNAELALKRQRRSVQVHVTLDGKEFDIDVVPTIAEGDIDETLLVPDRDLSKWIPSNPLGYDNFLSKLNKENSGKIVPLIKLFKHWRDIQMKRRQPKSYLLECLVCKYTEANKLDVEGTSFGELFSSLLVAIYEDFRDKWLDEDTVPKVNDPILGNNVAKSWIRDEFETFMRRIEESKRTSERALNAENEQDAAELWQSLFNDADGEEYFPTVVDEKLLVSLSGKNMFIASSGQVLSRPSAAQGSWQSPSHKNYGDD